MKFSPIRYLLFALPILGFSFTSCDEVSESDRLIPVETVTPARSILLEDFTGQGCRRCPEAHDVIHTLQEQYGDAVIAVSIHAGAFGVAVGSADYVGLMQPEGNEYDTRYNSLNTWPAGVVNRTGETLRHPDWAEAVRKAITTEPTVAIDLEATLSDDGKTINIATTLRPTANISGKLQLWITEDGIVTMQRNGSPWIPDYVHNHVYRAAVNGTWGEDVKLTSGVHADYNHSIAVRDSKDEKWDTAKLSVIAFVYNESEGVLQAARVSLLPAGNGGEGE